ncbi:MAG: GNAT family N-acetyltransferase, partial [Bacteroidia bacterium]
MILKTNRITLAEFVPSDADFIIELVNTPGWITYIGDRDIHDREAAEGYIQTLQQGYKKDGFGLYKMLLNESNAPIGMCGLVNRPDLDHPDIGFAILPEYERKGYTTEAGHAMVELAKEQYKLTSLLGITIPDN